jgi:molybdenum cofactor cytidylyltransferase
LLLLEGAEGAAGVVRAQAAVSPAARLELDDPGMVTDIDTLQDLAAAERLIAS